MVLSVRDPDKWFASTQNTVLNPTVIGFHDARGSRGMVEAVGWGSDPRLHDRDFMLERFERHIQDVKAAIPAERLLIYRVSDGWEPLCDFLGLPVPDASYPQVNSTDEFRAMIAARAADGGGIVDAH